MLSVAGASTSGPPADPIPVGFECNRGQFSPQVRFLWRGRESLAFFTARETQFVLRKGSSGPWKLRWEGARTLHYEPIKPALTRVHYFGSLASASGIHTGLYPAIRVPSLYPGIELVWRSREGLLECLLQVEPGASLNQVRMRWEGAERIEILPSGDARVFAQQQWLQLRRPRGFQQRQGKRVEIPMRYRLVGQQVLAFEPAKHDPQLPLVIDPVIEISRSIGGSALDDIRALAVDNQGNVYLAGTTESPDLPSTSGVAQPNLQSGVFPTDIFVAKVDAAGRLVYLTYAGGSQTDVVTSIALGPDGSVYVAGYTDSPDFPITPGAFQRFFQSGGAYPDGFLLRLAPAGDSIVYSSYIGSDGADRVDALAVDSAGSVYLAGTSDSDRWLVTPGAPQASCPGYGDGVFLAKLAPTGSLQYLSRLCGSGHDEAAGLAIDTQGRLYLVGTTSSPDFPTSVDALKSHNDGLGTDGFLTVVAPDGRSLLFSTYLGGTFDDGATGVAVDPSGRIWVTGYTVSPDFPITPGAPQPTHATGGFSSDAFLAQISLAPARLVFSTFIGGSGDDIPLTLHYAPGSGRIFLGGHTTSDDLPFRPEPCWPGYRGGRDGFVVWLDPDQASWGGFYLGGRNADQVNDLKVYQQRLYVAGQSSSPDFPVTVNGFGSLGGAWPAGTDGFLAVVNLGSQTAIPCVAPSGVVNAASFLPGPVAPGELVTIFGAGFGQGPGQSFSLVNGRVPTELAGVRVLFDGIAAPLLYVSPYQINLVVPYGVAGRERVTVEVELQGRSALRFPWPVAAASPAVFTLNAAGTGPGAVLNQDNTVNTPDNPAARGSVVQIYAHGQGQTIPAGIDGAVNEPPLPVPQLPVTVLIGGRPAAVEYAGAAPGYVSGLLQVNARVPLETSPGQAIPITLKIGEFTSPPGVTIAVE